MTNKKELANTVAYSDRRLKNCIRLLDVTTKIDEIRPVRYNRHDLQRHEFGFIAQEVKEIFPEVVIENEETGLLSLDYGKLSAVAIQAAKDNKAKIEEQQAQIDELRAMVEALSGKA